MDDIHDLRPARVQMAACSYRRLAVFVAADHPPWYQRRRPPILEDRGGRSWCSDTDGELQKRAGEDTRIFPSQPERTYLWAYESSMRGIDCTNKTGVHPRPLCLRRSFVKFPFHRFRANVAKGQKFLSRPSGRSKKKKKLRDRGSVAADTFPFNWRGVASNEVEGDFHRCSPFSVSLVSGVTIVIEGK